MSGKVILGLFVFFLCMFGVAAVFICRYMRNHPPLRRRRVDVVKILKRAHEESENLDVYFPDRKIQPLRARIEVFDRHELELLVDREVPLNLSSARVEVYLGVNGAERREFYKFASVVQSVKATEGVCRMTVGTPATLENGQKRAFYRVSLLPHTVSLVALWLRKKNEQLPRTTTEVGDPYLSSQDGEGDCFSIDIDNISAGGMGVRLTSDEERDMIAKDGEILCLMVYNESVTGGERLINFCCTGRITNIRPAPDDENVKILGIEFTNWALLQKGSSQIRWYGLDRTTGIEPILQWVQKIQKNQERRS